MFKNKFNQVNDFLSKVFLMKQMMNKLRTFLNLLENWKNLNYLKIIKEIILDRDL